jgi:HEAT repeat protein
MCQENNRFIFCSCVDEDENPEKDELVDYYTWYLTKYLGSKESSIRGKIMIPKKDLGNGITLKNTLDQLNSDTNCFDFDYVPSERDCLGIQIPHPIERHRYFKVIFIDNKWQQGSNYVFTSITEKIASGKIKRSISKGINPFQVAIWVTSAKDSIETLFDKLFTDSSTETHWNYITELVQREPEICMHKAASLVSSNLLKEKIIGVQLFIKLYYSKYNSEKILNIFFHLLKSEQEERVIDLLISVMDIDNKNLTDEQIDLLCTFKNHNEDIKLSLMSAFSEVDTKKTIDIYIELSNDENVKVKQTVIYNLAEVIETDIDEIRKALWDKVLDADQETRFYAIFGLVKRKDERIKDVLIRELENVDQHGTVLLESIEALQDKSLIPYIERQIEKNKDAESHLQEWLAETLDTLKSVK